MSPLAGRFLGRDPIGYLDGNSLYNNYFQLISTDPVGTVKTIIVKEVEPKKLKGHCGETFSLSWTFRMPREHKEVGFLVQEVSVTCALGNCRKTDPYVEINYCNIYPIEYPSRCVCDLKQPQSFTYYEAWYVGLNSQVPTNPPPLPQTPYEDTASFPTTLNTCGQYSQKGILKFYPLSETGNLFEDDKWKPDPNRLFGAETGCGTGAGLLLAFDGKNGPPTFWKNDPIAQGRRQFELDWRCCECDPPRKRKAIADGLK